MDKILLPLDGKPTAVRVLALAEKLLGKTGSLLLLQVPVVPDTLNNDPLVRDTAVWQTQLAHATAVAETYLAQQADLWRTQHPQPVHTLIRHGEPHELIARTAREEQVDLLLLATSGRARFGQWLLGGVAEQTVRYAECPVLLWRDETTPRHILVTLDGSPFAEQVLAPAIRIAKALGAEVTLLQVIDDDDEDEDEDEEDGARVAAEAYLAQCTAVWQPHLAQPLRVEVSHGRVPAPAITDYLRTHQIGLLALATHGLSGSLTSTYGSVAEKLIRNTDCSMLVLRPMNPMSNEQ
jgi:nucleotide-binding universal stress UspA family protein